MEKKCEDCLARGNWEGKHDCPPLMRFLVSHAKKKNNPFNHPTPKEKNEKPS